MGKEEKRKEELIEGLTSKTKEIMKKSISKVSPKPAGKGQGETRVSKTISKETVTPQQKETDFIDDIKVNEIIKPEVSFEKDELIDDIGEITKGKLTKPLDIPIFSPEKSKSESDELEDIIKSVEKDVDTANNVKGTGRVDDSDRTSEEDLIDKLTKTEKVKEQRPTPVKVVKASELKESDRIRLDNEEGRRRDIQSARKLARLDARNDEGNRRGLFNSEIEQMTKEFNLLMDEKYPEFSRRKNIKGSKKRSEEELKQLEIDRVESRKQIVKDKQLIKIEKKKLNTKKVERLKNEKNRKSEEGEFKVNRLRRSEVHTFFEGDILLEQKEKTERNPDITGETEVQIKRREIEKYEKRLGRKIVPHRDIVESEESDFDRNSNTTAEDMIIKVPTASETMKDFKKLNKLIDVRRRLDRGVNEEEIFSVKKIRESEPPEEPFFRKTKEN
jgi:hypothetical protein|tara:strand:- start:38 stop:1372 length:1335 start_codon:yes stop_codon:yes gene_type:complete